MRNQDPNIRRGFQPAADMSENRMRYMHSDRMRRI
jgi:hypothetical protein